MQEQRENDIDDACDEESKNYNEDTAREVELVEEFLSHFIFATSSKIED